MYPYLIITIVFIISRVLVLLAGVEFQWDGLIHGAQSVDPVLLRQRLAESIFYLHSQPPLFNLYLGVILKLFPEHYVTAFQVSYAAVGYILGLGLYELMRCFSVRRGIAVALTCYFLVNPAVILLENWLLYSHFVICLMCWTAVFLFRYLRSGRAVDGASLFTGMAVLVMTRGIFHLCWFGIFWLAVLIVRKGARRQVILVSILPLLLVFALYFKNLIVFGSFTTSRAWMAYNLIEMTSKNVPVPLIRRYCLDREISPLACGQVLAGHQDEYRAMLRDWNRELDVTPTGIAILDQVNKPTGKGESWHSARYLRIADYFLRDALTFLRLYPQGYGRTLKRAYAIMFYPAPTDLTFYNRAHLESYENWYNIMFAYQNRLAGGRLYQDRLRKWHDFDTMPRDLLSVNLYAAVIVFYLGLFVYGGVLLLRGWRSPERHPAYLVTLSFLLFNIVYIPVVCNFFAWIGSNRYRFLTEPYNLVIVGILLTSIVDRSRRLRMASESGRDIRSFH